MSKLRPNIDSPCDRPPFLSLSQFDNELQEQAQLAMQQEMDAWQDFENYLPQLEYPNTFHQKSKQVAVQHMSLADEAQFIDLAANNELNNLLSSQNNYSRDNVDWSPSNLANIPFVSPNSDRAISPFSSPSSILEPTQSPCQYASPHEPSSTTTVNETPNQSPKSKLFSFDFHFMSDQQEPESSNQDKSTDSNNTEPVIPQQKKRAHNVIERRYRNNINERITELKNTVPALLYAKVKDTKPGTKRFRKSGTTDNEEDDEEDSEEYLDGIAIATKLNKATILRKSTEYILHLKRKDKALVQENDILQRLVQQLPGGQDVLSRYLVQKTQREQEMHRQYLFEREMQRKKQQRKTAPGRKRSRLSAAPKKAKTVPLAPSTTNRVFMAAFMAISFFSASPLFTGPTTKEQFESHHHISRTAEDFYTNNRTSLISSIFPTHDGWSTLRTTIFVICLLQLFLPLFKSKIGIRVKNKRSRTKSLSGNITTHTPGDQKCMQIYSILAKSLKNDTSNKTQPAPRNSSLLLALLKEAVRFGFRHWLGYEVLYDCTLAPQEQWVQTCKWIKLNEVECLGGNPGLTRPSMLFSCLRVVNLIEAMDDENEYVEQSRSRVYATAALQMSLIIPHHGIAQFLAHYFWRLAMYESGLEDDPLMSALTFDCHEDDGEDRMEVMINSRAWYETLEVMRHQVQHFERGGLSLSMNAPVLVPVGILSTLHLLDNLQTQFGRLIISVTDAPLLDDASDFTETVFAQILDITSAEGQERVSDYHSLAHWLSAVGAIVEALWKSDIKTADTWICVLKKIPQSLVSREMMDEEMDTVDHKERLRQIDELIKKSIIHTLLGAYLLKKGNIKDLKQGVEELCLAEKIRLTLRNLSHGASFEKEVDLESSVLALAEFVTSVTGLEAWITAWRLVPAVVEDADVWEERLTKQVGDSCLQLRRMINRHSLDGLRTNEAIVERLSRLGAYTSMQREDVDSDYESSSDECESMDFGTLRMRRSDKALDILRGLA